MTEYSQITDDGDFCLEVEEEAGYRFGLLCCTILNNAGSLLTRKS